MATRASNEGSWINDLLRNSDGDTSDGSDGDSFTSSSESSAGKSSGNFPCHGAGHSTMTITGDGNAFSHTPHPINNSNSKKMRRRKGSPKAPPLPRQKATVKELAEEKTGCHAQTEVEANILARIRKCLDRANHPTTPENEAKAALHMSSRLMAQYNVTQADVLAQTVDSEQQKQYAGQSRVSITCTRGPFAKVISQTWVQRVAGAMEVFFDCKTYSTAGAWSIDWTFYGIAPNTVAAAIAFEMAHNLILEWAREKKGVINSYCLGVGQGLLEMAKEDKRREEREARKREQDTLSARLKEEELQRQKELDRLNNDVGMPDEPRVAYAAGIADNGLTSIEAPPNHDFPHHDGSSSDSDDDMGCPTFNDQFDEAEEAEPTFRE
jgi:polyhydroxyalkanoate synthesis regulator phasin